MRRDDDPGQRDDEPEPDAYDEEAPRSIFAALWFRALLAVLILGILAAVVVPYVLDVATHSTSDSSPAKRPAASAPAPASMSTAQPVASPQPVASTTASSPAPPTTATPAAPAVSTAAPAPVAPTPAAPVTATPSPSRPAREALAPKRTAAAVETPKTSTRMVAAAKPAAKTPTASGGPYWVQVGAFKDSESAQRLVTQLRGQGFHAEQSTTSKGGAPAPAASDAAGDRYAVVVSGGAQADVDAKLAAKGLTGETTAGTTVVKPSLALRDAVALSRDLADAGLTVQVRRTSAAATSPAPRGGGETWYRVRVGGFPDRAAAMASVKQLEEKGFKPFIATGKE